jgi:NAD(P)-dependent dehydrogenase (short-subunit alcohol dehydrogenase family)
MNLGLTGKSVLITGASRGIGAATARHMASEGADLILVARDPEALAKIRQDLVAEFNVSVEIAAFDLAVSANVETLAYRHSDVDIVVNNAGSVPGGGLLDVPEEQWRAGWDSKVFAYINMCRAYYPILCERGGGVIVNVIGSGSRQKRWDYICGGMGNAALDFLTEALGASSHRDNIRIVAVSPGAVDTGRLRSIRSKWLEPKNAALLPFGRLATPEEVAATIVFLASPRSSYASGTVVVVDGGYSASRV